MKRNYALLPVFIGLSLYPWSNASARLLDLDPNYHATVYVQGKLRGVVRNEDGQSMSGVSVLNLQTKETVQTDDNGIFEIIAAVGIDIRVSMVGYKSQVIKADGNRKEITLQRSDESLDEVVVVGYGRQKKVNLTGAVTQIDSKILDNRPVANAAQALQGAVPNLNITFTNGRPGVREILIYVGLLLLIQQMLLHWS